MTRAQQISALEERCRRAHAAGVSWSDFWPSIDETVRELEPLGLGEWRKLYDRLMHLTVTGDAGGQYPPPMMAPWELPEEKVVDDTDTKAQLQRQLFDTSNRAGID